MIWLFFSFFLLAFNNVVWKWAARDEHSLYLISRRAIFTVSFTALALFITETGGLSFITQPLFYRIVVGCLAGTLGLILMVTFLKSGSLTRLSYYMFFWAGYKRNIHLFLKSGTHYPKNCNWECDFNCRLSDISLGRTPENQT